MHEYQEVQVNGQLRKVLEEEGVGSHKLSKSNRLLCKCHCIVDTEGVKDCRQEHILSYKGQEAVSFHEGLSVLKCLVDLAKPEYHRHRVAQHEYDEDRHRVYEVPHFTLDEHDKEASV